MEKVVKEKKLDLSSDEDLSIAIMNLISIEEHLFFIGNKTEKTKHFDLLNEVRQMRKELLKKNHQRIRGRNLVYLKAFAGGSDAADGGRDKRIG